MILTKRCEDVVIGTILGDGCLERNWKNVRLRIDHSETQQSLVRWKYIELKELSPSNPKRVEVFDKRTEKVYVSYRFLTQTTEKLNNYFSLFYGERKQIPKEISKLLTSPLSLAVWYMDDGGRRNDCRSGYLNTQSFAIDEVNLLRECLESNFDIQTKIHFAAQRPRIYISQNQFEKFCDLIRPFIIPDLQYKLL